MGKVGAISANIQSAYDEQYSDAMNEWRELGGKYKAQNIMELCEQFDIERVLEVGAGEGSILLYLDKWKFAKELHAVEISQSGVDFICKREIPSLEKRSTI